MAILDVFKREPAPASPPPDAVPSSSLDISITTTTTDKPAQIVQPSGRLGMHFPQRVLLGGLTAFAAGFTIGSAHAGHMAGLRFRAENAHRLPISRPGWYLYQKSKNYVRMRAGISEGVRKGVWLASLGTMFFVLEEAFDVEFATWRPMRSWADINDLDEREIDATMDHVEKSRNFLSSTMAGFYMGCLWSLWNKFPPATAWRTMRTGTLVGLGYGLTQDGLHYVRRQTGGYQTTAFSWIYKKDEQQEQPEEQADQKLQ